MKLQTKIKKALETTNNMILACKAKGGYKFRQRFKCTDLELEKMLKMCETQIRQTAISLVVAEAMLREHPPSIHSRWKEYQRRRKEALG